MLHKPYITNVSRLRNEVRFYADSLEQNLCLIIILSRVIMHPVKIHDLSLLFMQLLHQQK